MKRGVRAALVAGLVIGVTGFQEDYFSVVLLPDTQYYSLRDHTTYFMQTEWIVANRARHKTRFVAHLGDITDQNDLGDHIVYWKAQWNAPDVAHQKLDAARIPYSVTTGNHDYPWTGDGKERRVRDASRFNSVFPASRFEGRHDFEGNTWYGGHFGGGTENNYAFFSHSGLDFIVLSLEYAPRKDAMCWADRILRTYSAKRAIVVTHCYQASGGGHKSDCGQQGYRMTGASPEALWRELVRQNPNVFLVLSGHVTDSEHKMRNRLTNAVVTDTTAELAPTTVHELMTDYQRELGVEATHEPLEDRLKDHGNGWLRRLEFHPSSSRVDVTVHSVLGARQFRFGPAHDRYSSDPNAAPHKFSFRYDMAGPPPTTGATPSDRFADRTVNSDATRDQLAPRVARLDDEGWVTVWEDDSHGAEGQYQVYARGFDANGCERFKDKVVNTAPAGQQRKPTVAANTQGRFVVAWEDSPDGNLTLIKARGFEPNGDEWLPQFTVDSVPSGQQRRPAVAINNGGNFVIVWEDDRDGNGSYQVKVRGFDHAGAPRFAQRTVNAAAAGQQRRPAVAMRQNSDFIVVWEDDGGDGVYQIKARGFVAKADTTTFEQRTVNAVATGQQRRPAIAMDAGGRFVVVWEDSGDDDVYQIVARGFDAKGDTTFKQRTVNNVSTGQQRNSSVSAHADGRFVVAWEDSGDDESYQIKARAFRQTGIPLWNEVTVNSLKSGQQLLPSVALAPSGRFVTVWQDDLEKNNAWEILARGCHITSKCTY